MIPKTDPSAREPVLTVDDGQTGTPLAISELNLESF